MTPTAPRAREARGGAPQDQVRTAPGVADGHVGTGPEYKAGGASAGQVLRFDVAERVTHWTTAAVVLVLIATGAILYIPTLALMVGNRGLVEQVHVVTGLALFAPLLIGLAGPWGRRLRADIGRLDRWGAADFDWFRNPRKRLGLARDKFNGGQKLEAAFLGGTLVATLVTGVIMRFGPSSWIRWQTGATLVHDVLFLAIVVAVGAHIAFALSRPDQMVSMLTGKIPLRWVRSHATAWLGEVSNGEDTSAGTVVPPSPELNERHETARR